MGTKMLLFGSVLLVTGLICNIEAVGPTVSNNEWTPVVNSQRVYLSPEVLAKYRQEELQGTQANERYDVVDNANSKVEYTDDVNVNEETSTEEVIIIQEEQQFEPQRVKTEVVKVELPTEIKKVEEEQKPIIIYPEGTISQPNNNGFDDRPAPVYPSANQPQTKYQPRPPPPQERRPAPPPRRPDHLHQGVLGDPHPHQNICLLYHERHTHLHPNQKKGQDLQDPYHGVQSDDLHQDDPHKNLEFWIK